VRATTLAGYENVVHAKHNILGPTSWILPVGIYHRTHRQFGLQYCPLCLAEDKVPYYRRKWRLAFLTSCEKHHVLLQDCCPHCRSPINFHRNDTGTFHKYMAESLTLCHACSVDLRISEARFRIPASPHESAFVTKLLLAIDKGFVQLNESMTTYAQLYFAGLRQIMKIVAMRDARIDMLRRTISRQFGVALYSPPTLGLHKDVQEMGLEDRRRLLGIACCILEEWPHRFIELSEKHSVWSSLWLRHLDPPVRPHSLPAPFWFWSVVHDHLYRAKYCPSDEEIKAAATYLKRHGKVINKSTLAKILGVRVLRRDINESTDQSVSPA
jgi:hypothetical protein